MLSALIAHPKRTLLAVVLFVVVAGVLGGPVAGSLETDGGFTATDSGSARAEARIEAATGAQAAPGVVALVDDPARAADVACPARSASPGSCRSRQPDASRDGRSAYRGRTLRATPTRTTSSPGSRSASPATATSCSAARSFAGSQIGDSVSEDLGRAEMLAFPVLMLLSLLFFRGRATVLPLAVGITTVLGTFLALTAVNQAYALSIFALNLVIGLGLGLAIDYTLFLVTRFREELAKANPARSARRCAPPAGPSSSAP